MTIGILPALDQWYQNGPAPYFPGPTVAGLTKAQQDAWTLGSQAGQSGVQGANNALNAYNQGMGMFSNALTSGAGGVNYNLDPNAYRVDYNSIGASFDPWNNPQLREYADAMTQDFNTSFQRSLPQQDLQALQAGQMGSSRHGIAEGLARSDFQNQTGKFLSDYYKGAYDSGLNRYVQDRGNNLQTALGSASNALQADQTNMQGAIANANNQVQMYGIGNSLLQNYANASMMPSTALNMYAQNMANIGAQQQDQNQRQLDSSFNQWNYQTNAPYDHLAKYASMISGASNGYNSTSGVPIGNQPNVFGNILGTAATLGAGFLAGPASAGMFGAGTAAKWV